MHKSINNLTLIDTEIKTKFGGLKNLNIIAISKTFPINEILPLIKNGHIHFGENKVQEAVQKWAPIKDENKKIKLHLIGRLQTNKVKLALNLFDYIHSLDSEKLANKISKVQNELNVNTKLFIQVNIGNEIQKSGIPEDEVLSFYNYCKSLKLDVIGLMCIPPLNEETSKYFLKMNEINKKLKLNELSMGMSTDYLEAIENNATFIRIGSSIFGQRS